jgi:two-component system response regulator YcbB
MCPDMILADLTLSASKTIAYIQKIREILPQTSVVILSHFNDMDIIRMAYEKGAELLIHKPYNEIEVRNVLHNMEMARAMQWLIGKARNDFSAGAFSWEANVQGRKMRPEEQETDYNQSIRRLKGILQEIGILSEAGSKDIIRIVRYLIEEDLDIRDITVRELCSRMGQNSKSVEQRIRRAASVGMANLAYRGMDDYADPVFNEYGARLYSLEQIKREMSYIRGKSDGHGNVRVRKFLSGLLVCCKDI